MASEKKKTVQRYTHHDTIAAGGESDAEFQKALRELEDIQASKGHYLLARGALDKADAAYLIEEEEKRRHMENAVLERERRAFEEARRALEEGEDRSGLCSSRGEMDTGRAVVEPGEKQKKRRVDDSIMVKRLKQMAKKRKEEESGVEERPRSGVEEQPKSGVEERPRSGVEERPKSGVEEQPKSGVEERPRSGVEERPRSGVEERPRSGVEERPKSGEEQYENTNMLQKEGIKQLEKEVVEEDINPLSGLLGAYKDDDLGEDMEKKMGGGADVGMKKVVLPSAKELL